MVTRNLPILAAGALLAHLAAGCSNTGDPVYPKGGAPVLLLKPPDGLQALWQPSVPVLVKYRVTGKDHAPVTGSVSVGAGQTIDTVSIALPSRGPKVVSAEWFEPEMDNWPRYLGADRVDVQEETPLTLKMGRLDNCYEASMDVYYYFNFDMGSVSADYMTADLYLGMPQPDQPQFDCWNGAEMTYLGNGDMLDFVEIPAGAVFHGSSLAAKGNAPLAEGDVFGVSMPDDNAYAWMQVSYIYTSFTMGSVNFRYRYNDQDDLLCVFDETTYGHNSCNENNPN